MKKLIVVLISVVFLLSIVSAGYSHGPDLEKRKERVKNILRVISSWELKIFLKRLFLI